MEIFEKQKTHSLIDWIEALIRGFFSNQSDRWRYYCDGHHVLFFFLIRFYFWSQLDLFCDCLQSLRIKSDPNHFENRFFKSHIQYQKTNRKWNILCQFIEIHYICTINSDLCVSMVLEFECDLTWMWWH